MQNGFADRVDPSHGDARIVATEEDVALRHGPWFAIREYGDEGSGVAIVHWKGVVAIAAPLILGGGGLLAAGALFGGTPTAFGIALAVLAISLAGLFIAIMRRTVDERSEDRR